MNSSPRVTELAHAAVADCLRPGDTAIDATVGNGYDTLFLANRCGATGRVIGFDIQPEAIEATRTRLTVAGFKGELILRLSGHEEIRQCCADLAGKVRAVMFNLGYLPGGDHEVITRPDTTVAALTGALPLLASGGILTAVSYRGHPGGCEESDAVANFCSSLDRECFEVTGLDGCDESDGPLLMTISRPSAVPA